MIVKPEVLLDTCALIWIAGGQPIAPSVERLLDTYADEQRSVYISPFSGWEISMLMSRGRLPSVMGPKEWFNHVLSLGYAELASLDSDILIDSCQLPGNPPRDPADRIIISTARHLNLEIITRDRVILDYAKAGYVKAKEC